MCQQQLDSWAFRATPFIAKWAILSEFKDCPYRTISKFIAKEKAARGRLFHGLKLP
jgi:hypothetical protein